MAAKRAKDMVGDLIKSRVTRDLQLGHMPISAFYGLLQIKMGSRK